MSKLTKANVDALTRGIEFVSLNDNEGGRDSVRQIASYISVIALSESFQVPADRIAGLIANVRRAAGLEVGEEESENH